MTMRRRRRRRRRRQTRGVVTRFSGGGDDNGRRRARITTGQVVRWLSGFVRWEGTATGMADKKHNTDVDDGGLPVEPERRRAAVDAQFDDFKARLADLDEPTAVPTAGGMTTLDYRATLDRVEADLLVVVSSDTPSSAGRSSSRTR